MTVTVPLTSQDRPDSADGTVTRGSTVGPDSEVAVRPRRSFWIDLTLRSVSILGFFGLWYAFSLMNEYVWRSFNPSLLPPPHVVLEAGIALTLSGELPRHVLASLN